MADHWNQVETLCQAVLERPANQRAAFLLEATAGDDALRREVELLIAHKSHGKLPAESSEPRAAALIQGSTLSHYQLAEELGAGGMGRVYRAHDLRLDRDVALKVLPAGRFASEMARSRFRKEALALAKLNHPHIGAVYDFDAQGGLDFLVMEYVPGATLSQRLFAGALPESEVVSLGTQIVAALEEAHEHEIVHCDLKPGNVVVTPKGQAKVLDFGLAKLVHPAEELATADDLSKTTGLGAGTLPYMAPEQLRGQPADPRADIYAAGTMLYEMSTGQRPFTSRIMTALAADIQTQKPKDPRQVNSRISPGLQQIILKCLEKDPADRYQSAKELLVDLRRLTKAIPVASGSRARLVGVLAGVLAVALSAGFYLAYRRSWLWFKPSPGKIALAVLPFENLNHDPQEDYFCDGLTDEMINQLGRLMPERLGVIARTSAMRYKGTPKRADEIGRELDVNYLLESSVRRENGRVRIAAQLIQARNQTTLWTETYEYEAAGVFALESAVASRIAQSLALQLLPGAANRPYKTSPQAYDAYLHGRYHWHKGSAEEKRKARSYFEQAIEMDPKFAQPYAGLADYYWGTSDLPSETAMPKAKEYARKALELDDSLPEAHVALAGIRFYSDWDWAGAGSEFKRALALNPNDAEAHRTYSNFLLTQGRFDEALAKVQRAQELDPLSLYTSVNAGWTMYFARQYDRAIEQCRKALDLDSESDGAHACLAGSYRAKGLGDLAISEGQRAVALTNGDPSRLVGLARIYAAFGRKDEARKLLADLGEQAKQRYVSAYDLAMIHATLGEQAQALDALEKAYGEHDANLPWLKIENAFDPLRAQVRFQDLLRRVGLTP
jgi:serine/threonine-protein kinase